MKAKNAILMVAGLALIASACSKSDDPVEEVPALENEVKSTEVAEILGDSCVFTSGLTAEEEAGLLYMREEEKLAHDVYVTFYEKYSHIVFRNISNSEAAHTKAIAYLLEGFELDDPALEAVGQFTNETLQTMYSDLIAQGGNSLIEALKVGALIEEVDIKDLQHEIEIAENETIKRVYGNLLRGSTFHLKAFTGILSRYGVTYVPTVLSQGDFDVIVGTGSTDDEDEDTDTSTGTFTPGTGVCDGTGPNA
ncbi:MAG: DUF2202 domain-containing protein [Draconibacterium sp.]